MRRSTVQFVCYLAIITAASWLIALLLAPWLPFPFPKILRRITVILAALTLWPFVLRVQHRPFHTLGLEWSATMWRQFWQGAAIGAGLFAMLLLLLRVACVIRFRLPERQEWSLLIAFVPVAAVIGLLEEIFFRGVTLQSLLADVGMLWAIIISSTFYACLHFVRFLAHPLAVLPELAGLFLFGCVLAMAYLRTKLLALPIGFHMSLAYLAKMGRHFIDFIGREPVWLFGNNRWLTGLLSWGLLGMACLMIAGVTRRPVGD